MEKKKTKNDGNKYRDADDGLIMDINLEKDMFVWSQMERPFKKRNKEFWLTSLAILILVSVIFFFMKEFMLVMALFSALFLYYVMSTVPPSVIKYRITNRGIYWGDSRMEWEYLKRFWIKSNLDSEAIYFETHLRFPRQLSMIINPEDKEYLKKIISRRIPCLDDSPQFVDKVNNWISKKIPMDSVKKNEQKKN